MKTAYIYYNEQHNINYCFLFCLYCIAEKNPKEKLNNIVWYDSIKQLSNKIYNVCNYKISVSTISRILNAKQIYNNYFSKSVTEKNIILKNNYRGAAADDKFVSLSEKEIIFLLQQDNNQLNRYYLYLKYYCGYSKSKQIDSTANQILSALGYSCNCGNNKNNLCKYNTLLLEKGFIKIQKIKDEKGHIRNIYSMSL